MKIDDWTKLLFAILIEAHYDTRVNWQHFCNITKDIIKEYPKEDLLRILNVFSDLKDECSYTIKANTHLYRARKLNYQDIQDIFNKPQWQDLFKRLQKEFAIIQDTEFSYFNLTKFLELLPIIPNNEKFTYIFNEWKKDYKDIAFWGFDKAGSGSPQKPKEGRFNRKKQRNLYLANNIKTAIAEVQPIINQIISIANIKILRDLKLYDLTKKFNPEYYAQSKNYLSFENIINLCMEVNYGDKNFYKPTQRICDHIKKLKFDGIIYLSSLNSNGKNIMIFNTKNKEIDEKKNKATFEIINTSLYSFNNYNFKYKKIIPI